MLAVGILSMPMQVTEEHKELCRTHVRMHNPNAGCWDMWTLTTFFMGPMWLLWMDMIEFRDAQGKLVACSWVAHCGARGHRWNPEARQAPPGRHAPRLALRLESAKSVTRPSEMRLALGVFAAGVC